MKKNKVKIIGAIAIVLVLTLGIALSYAFFSTSDKQKTANTFRSGCLNITIETESSAITLNNAYPISDLEGLNNKGYTFTIKNTCNKDTNYMINLESLNQVSNTLDSNYLKVALESDTMDNLISKLGDNPSTEALITGAYESHNLYNGTISANTSKEFTLREWIDYDVTKEQGMNKTVTNKINVIARPDLNVNELNIKSNIEGTTLTGTLTNNVTDVKYCVSDKNICDGTTNTNINENKVTINNLENKNQLVCSKLNNDIIYCVKGNKVDPILANGFLRDNAEPESFESITILNKIEIPNTAIKSWDASEANNGSVMAYYTDTDSNGLYELYLAGNGKVFAPDNSFALFADVTYENNEIVDAKTYNNLTNIDVKYLDTSKVTNMANMFSDLSKVTNLDVSNFDTSNVIDMSGMFVNMANLANLNVSNFNTSKVTNMLGMFEGMYSLTNLDVSNFDTSNVINMAGMFMGLGDITTLDVSNFNTRNVTNMSSMFQNMESLTELDLSNFNTSNVTDMSSMFSAVINLKSLNLTNFDTSNVTDMGNMFYRMESLKSLDVSNFDTSNVTEMYEMFEGMSSLISLNVSSFDTSNVTNMFAMFRYMESINELDLSNFDTSNVTNMEDMFSWMSSLTSLDLRKADFSKVTNSTNMFDGTDSLETILTKDEEAVAFLENLTSASVYPYYYLEY